MLRPALVRITKGTVEACEASGGQRCMVPMEWWWVRVTQDGELVRAGGAPTLRRAIRCMRRGLDADGG
jgi:hypothetical protein